MTRNPDAAPAPPGPPSRGAVRRLLLARGLFGAAALGLAAWVGGTVGAALAAVTALYLAATLYWSLRLRPADDAPRGG